MKKRPRGMPWALGIDGGKWEGSVPAADAEFEAVAVVFPMVGFPTGAGMGWAIPATADPDPASGIHHPVAVDPDVISSGGAGSDFGVGGRGGFGDDSDLLGGRAFDDDDVVGSIFVTTFD